jgi:hypothetical protein
MSLRYHQTACFVPRRTGQRGDACLQDLLDVSDVIWQRPRKANVMKLAINYNVISTIELISQSYIFAEKCGLPLEYLRDFYQELWFAHPAPKDVCREAAQA